MVVSFYAIMVNKTNEIPTSFHAKL